MASAPSSTLSDLRRAVSALEPDAARPAGAVFGFGLPALDDWLGGGLPGGALHEVYARQGRDGPAAAGFALGLAMRAAGNRQIVWARQDILESEMGCLHGAGIAAFGLDPGRLILVRARDPTATLRVAGEVARCSALGAALVEIWGEPKCLDLKTTRRLALAAAASGVTLLMVRFQAEPAPSAAASRWSVTPSPSTPLEADAPGHPVFDATLLRHRAGLGPRNWRLEWDRDSLAFADPALPGPVVSVPADGSAAAEDDAAWRRAG